jgi:Uma2 family endonuclease
MTPATLPPPASTDTTLGDLLDRLAAFADIPPRRIRLNPWPGNATEADVLALAEAANPVYCELVNGVLVEKTMGIRESSLTRRLVVLLELFIFPRNLGLLFLPDGLLRLFPGRVRGPDISFISWDRLPGRVYPTAPLPDLVPDLVVEVISVSNTPREMQGKRDDYFGAGVRLVWEVDPHARTVAVYTRPDVPDAVLTAADTLPGDPVLPGFTLPLADLFAELDRHG